MSDVVTRILRAAGETGRPAINAVVLLQDRGNAVSVVDQLTALGCRAIQVPDEKSAAALLVEDADINVLVVDGNRGDEELEALTARLSARRTALSSLALIKLDGRKPGEMTGATPISGSLIQSATLQSLPSALDAIDKSLALTTGEVQRQVEVIARAVIKLGQRLHRISNDSALVEPELSSSSRTEISSAAEPDIDNGEVIATLRSLINSRRLRDRFFRDARFGEPAWDILLDLALAWFEKKSVSASSVCIASGVPMSTAMRWINEMVEVKLIERWIDPTDGRRNLVQIAPATRLAMLHYIAALKQAASLPSPSDK